MNTFGGTGRPWRPVVALAFAGLVAACLGGCGTAGFRDNQDWGGVSDVRVHRTCLVTDEGEGYWFAHSDDGSYILTAAHVLGDSNSADVYLHNPYKNKYVKFTGEVVAKTHPQKEDLALLRLTSRPDFSDPFRTAIAKPLHPYISRRVEIMNTGYGAERRPLVMRFPARENYRDVVADKPDEWGQREWELLEGVVHGGLKKTTPGSPVFEGDRLVAVTERVPGETVVTDDEGQHRLARGVCTCTTADIRTFLWLNGYQYLIENEKP